VTQQVINRGSLLADHTGEDGFSAMGKANANFTELYNDVDIFSVKNYGAVGDGVADDTAAINAAVAEAKAVGGGTIYLSSGTYLVSSTILLSGNNLVLRGAGGDANHNAGTVPPVTTVVRWGGAASGTVIEASTPIDGTKAQLSGCGVQDMKIDCAAVAGIGLLVISMKFGRFKRLYFEYPTIAAIKTTTRLNVDIADHTGTQHNIFEQINALCRVQTASKQAHGIWITSSTPTGGQKNSSLNTFIDINTSNSGASGDLGSGVVIEDGDNNLFLNVTCSRVTTGAGSVPGVLTYGYPNADGNVFVRLTAAGTNGIVIRGTASGDPSNTVRNTFYGADSGNNTAYPVMDAGCKVYWADTNGTNYVATVALLGKVVVNNNAGNYTVPVRTSYVAFTGTQAASVLFTFPAGASAIDGLAITIFTAAAVGTASTWASTGTTFVGAPATLAANSVTTFRYDHASLQWLRA